MQNLKSLKFLTFEVNLDHSIFLSSKEIIKSIICRQLNGYDEEYLVNNEDTTIDNIEIFNLTNKIIEETIVFLKTDQLQLIEPKDKKEILMNLSLGDKNRILLLHRSNILGNTIQLVTNCLHCEEKISHELSISDLFTHIDSNKPNSHYDNNSNTNTITANKANSQKIHDDFKVKPLKVRDQYILINNSSNFGWSREKKESSERSDTITDKKDLVNNKILREFVKNCIIEKNNEISFEYFLSEEGIEKISNKLLEIDPLSSVDLNLHCPYCENMSFQNLYIEFFILQELFLHSKVLALDLNLIALNYNWSEEAILSLPLSKRKNYVNLISKTLSGELYL